MHKRENWDDLRYVLAVAKTGSISSAARSLKVNHATVLRRVAAFEGALGAEVFEKSLSGYKVRPDRLRLIDSLKEVEAAVTSANRVADGARAAIEGTVRITSTDSLCQGILPDVLRQIHQKEGNLKLELLATNLHLDLARMRADISVRPAEELSPDLVGDIAGYLEFAVYRSKGADAPDWLGLTGNLANSLPGIWLSAQAQNGLSIYGADSFVTLAEMCALGLGKAILPRYIGDIDPRLDAIGGAIPQMKVPIWVASHAELADVARIRIAREMLLELLVPAIGKYLEN